MQNWQRNWLVVQDFRCQMGYRGGDVALLVRENITAVCSEDILVGMSNNAFWVEFRNKKRAIILLL